MNVFFSSIIIIIPQGASNSIAFAYPAAGTYYAVVNAWSAPVAISVTTSCKSNVSHQKKMWFAPDLIFLFEPSVEVAFCFVFEFNRCLCCGLVVCEHCGFAVTYRYSVGFHRLNLLLFHDLTASISSFRFLNHFSSSVSLVAR
jgi:hypothetical protein